MIELGIPVWLNIALFCASSASYLDSLDKDFYTLHIQWKWPLPDSNADHLLFILLATEM